MKRRVSNRVTWKIGRGGGKVEQLRVYHDAISRHEFVPLQITCRTPVSRSPSPSRVENLGHRLRFIISANISSGPHFS